MTRENNTPTSFNDVEPGQIVIVKKTDEQKPIYKSFNQETWCCAWAPDCSYVAWSQGGGIVYLLPWNRDNGSVLKKPAQNVSCDDLTSLDKDTVLLQSLPRISPPDDVESSPSSNDSSPCDSWCNEKPEERTSYKIDCGSLVWSLAFGSGISENRIHLWRRFIFNQDLILATGLQCGKIKLWNVYQGHLLMELLDHRTIVRGLSFSHDGSLKLLSCSNDYTIKFWDLNSDGNMYKTLRFDNNAMVFGCKWSPTSKQVAAVGMNKNAYIWNMSDFSKRKLVGHYHHVCDCDFSPDGAILATCSYDTSAILWDSYTGDVLFTLYHMFPPPRPIYAGGANDHYVRGISWSRDGQHLSSVSDDGYVRFWDVQDVSNPHAIAESQEVLCCRYSPNGHIVSTGDRDGRLTFYHPVVSVPKLQHLCRLELRKRLPTQSVDKLLYPIALKEYLKYKV